MTTDNEDIIKRIIHLKEWFESEPEDGKFLEEKDWIIETYLLSLVYTNNLLEIIHKQSDYIDRLKVSQLNSAKKNAKNDPDFNGEQKDIWLRIPKNTNSKK